MGGQPVPDAHEVVLNELAQGIEPLAEGAEWFEGCSEDDRRDVPESIERSGIRPTS
ncbi:hypothetical protein [Streptomyces sp. NPDC091383]|uniref:hypothetical protein n=1 Tax=Streptomyces sp. NPDC091383 TaxID=3365996 RepID=UPI003807FDC6